MARFDVFVGRTTELALIDEWAGKQGTTHVIVIDGEGGIGKTFLLRKIELAYRSRQDLAVDFYDFAEEPPGTIHESLHLAGALGWENLPRFQEQANRLAQGDFDIADPHWEEEMLSIGLAEMNALLRQKRLIRIADTLEATRPLRASQEAFLEYACQMSNTLFVYAGREAKTLLPEFHRVFGPEHVTYVALDEFDPDETRQFFLETDKNHLVSSDLRAKLHFLTNGRPILLALAVEWLTHDIPLPDIADKSLDDLRRLPQDQLSALYEQFEFELVDRVRTLKDPQDRALLRMAHVYRRNDADILAILLNIPRSQAQDVVVQLAELSFVKYNPDTGDCVLHDEMRNLINRHAWPYVDPTGQERRNLLRQVINGYYEPRIQELSQQVKGQLSPGAKTSFSLDMEHVEWRQWRLEAETLFYLLQLNETEARAYFEEHFQEAQRSRHIVRIQYLLGEMERSGRTDLRDMLELRKAEAQRLRGEVAPAQATCEAVIRNPGASSENLITAHTTLGRILASDSPQQAQSHYEKALALAEQTGQDRSSSILYNNLGQLAQSIGQLAQALQYYGRAIECGKRANDQPLIASARNNAAYVYMLQGDLVTAEHNCRLALFLRQKQGVERELAYSYLTMGEICRNKGDSVNTHHFVRLALGSFKKLDDLRGQIMAYRALANVSRNTGRYDESETYLKQALALVGQSKDEQMLAGLYNTYGRLQRSRALALEKSDPDGAQELYKQTEAYIKRSMAIADQYNDQWLLARGELELALIYRLAGWHAGREIEGLISQAEKRCKSLDERTLLGYAEEQRGQLALQHQEYRDAAYHLGLAARWTAQWPGRDQRRYYDRLQDVLLDPSMPSADAIILAKGILQVIAEHAADDPLRSLYDLCQQVLETVNLGEHTS